MRLSIGIGPFRIYSGGRRTPVRPSKRAVQRRNDAEVQRQRDIRLKWEAKHYDRVE